MSTLIDDFFDSVTDEFGNKIDFSNIETEGFNGCITFSNFEYYAELYITENEFEIYNSNLNESLKNQVDEFIKYVQQKMKESREYFENNKIK